MFDDPATTDPYAGAVTWDRAGDARIAVLYPPYFPLVRTHLNGLRALVERQLTEPATPAADPRLALLVERMRETTTEPQLEPDVLADVRTRLDWALSVLPEHGGVLELHTPMHQWWWGRALLDVCTAITALLGAWLRGEACRRAALSGRRDVVDVDGADAVARRAVRRAAQTWLSFEE